MGIFFPAVAFKHSHNFYNSHFAPTLYLPLFRCTMYKHCFMNVKITFCLGCRCFRKTYFSLRAFARKLVVFRFGFSLKCLCTIPRLKECKIYRFVRPQLVIRLYNIYVNYWVHNLCVQSTNPIILIIFKFKT